MNKQEMVDVIVADMEGWLEREAESFWEHVKELETNYLKGLDDKEVAEIYENSK